MASAGLEPIITKSVTQPGLHSVLSEHTAPLLIHCVHCSSITWELNNMVI